MNLKEPMSLLKIFENVKLTEPNQVKLTVTSDLSFLTQSVKDTVLELYGSPNLIFRIIGSIINAAYTQKKTTFLWSKRICNELLKNDRLSTRKTINTKTFKEVNKFLYQNKFVEVLRESDDNRGAIVEIIMMQIVSEIESLVGKEYLELQKATTIEYYDTFGQGPTKGPTNGSHVSVSGSVPVYANGNVSDLKPTIQNLYTGKKNSTVDLANDYTIFLATETKHSTLVQEKMIVQFKALSYLLGLKDLSSNHGQAFKDMMVKLKKGKEPSDKQWIYVRDIYNKSTKPVESKVEILDKSTLNDKVPPPIHVIEDDLEKLLDAGSQND